MNRLFWVTVLALIAFVCTSMATEPEILGTCGQTTYSTTDNFGDIMGTIPWTSPGTNNAWVGQAWANGELIQFKNIYPNTAPSQFLRVNPSTGAIIATVNLPFNGYVMDGTFDGTALFVAQWSPSGIVHRVSLAGAELSSFTPVTGGYSPRSPSWDGTNLWLGCDLSSSSTKLIKMTSAGVNIQEWMTGTAVGWYMGSEFSTNAPANANLYVVDNVGNTIKRLSIGTSVTVAAQVASPATSPDIGEGLTFDGDLLWHCGAYSSAGVIWKIDDGFPPPTLNLNVTMTPNNPPIVVPANGGSFTFDASVVNNGTQTPFVVWARIKNPDGTYTGLTLGPATINPPAGQTVTRNRTQSVPSTWAPGLYYYIGYANTSVSYPAADADSFSWTKSTTSNGGPTVWEATCYGELFPGEVPVSTPASFGVAKVSPNPFNPTTTISFSLPSTQHVTLNVYDMSGRLVTTLVNGVREAGLQQVTFDGSNLASGVYMYTLNAGANVVTGKMALVK